MKKTTLSTKLCAVSVAVVLILTTATPTIAQTKNTYLAPSVRSRMPKEILLNDAIMYYLDIISHELREREKSGIAPRDIRLFLKEEITVLEKLIKKHIPDSAVSFALDENENRITLIEEKEKHVSDVSVIDAYIRALNSPIPKVRYAAIESITEEYKGQRRLIKELVRIALGDVSEMLRYQAIRALKRVDWQGEVALSLTRFFLKNKYYSIRHAALYLVHSYNATSVEDEFTLARFDLTNGAPVIARIEAINTLVRLWEEGSIVYKNEEIMTAIWHAAHNDSSYEVRNYAQRISRRMRKNNTIGALREVTLELSEQTLPTILVTGGAGFLGTHFCKLLLDKGYRVICVDNLISGLESNVAMLLGHAHFHLIKHNIVQPLSVLNQIGHSFAIDVVVHLASLASPVFYYHNPVETARVGAMGIFNALDIAREHEARFIFSSTSEIYGDPEVHPQTEEYWGNVNSLGPRSQYDEGKRFSESVSAVFKRQYGMNVRIARIFNTFGPLMRIDDGRVVTNFILKALLGKPLEVYGDGLQTRSLCYVDDLVQGLYLLMEHPFEDDAPIEERVFNLGNPGTGKDIGEITMNELARTIVDHVGSNSEILNITTQMTADDPKKRKPNIDRAKKILGWQPRISLQKGLENTIDWVRQQTFLPTGDFTYDEKRGITDLGIVLKEEVENSYNYNRPGRRAYSSIPTFQARPVPINRANQTVAQESLDEEKKALLIESLLPSFFTPDNPHTEMLKGIEVLWQVRSDLPENTMAQTRFHGPRHIEIILNQALFDNLVLLQREIEHEIRHAASGLFATHVSAPFTEEVVNTWLEWRALQADYAQRYVKEGAMSATRFYVELYAFLKKNPYINDRPIYQLFRELATFEGDKEREISSIARFITMFGKEKGELDEVWVKRYMEAFEDVIAYYDKKIAPCFEASFLQSVEVAVQKSAKDNGKKQALVLFKPQLLSEQALAYVQSKKNVVLIIYAEEPARYQAYEEFLGVEKTRIIAEEDGFTFSDAIQIALDATEGEEALISVIAPSTDELDVVESSKIQLFSSENKAREYEPLFTRLLIPLALEFDKRTSQHVSVGHNRILLREGRVFKINEQALANGMRLGFFAGNLADTVSDVLALLSDAVRTHARQSVVRTAA